MNDLERELKDLFHEHARGVDAPVLAPDAVLRRGRQRQVRTVIGGALASIVAIALVASAIGAVRRPDTAVPAQPGLVAARSTSIGGVPVTAPAGWTLVNDWPLATLLPASSEHCSFSSSATQVAPGAPDASPVESQPQASPECTSTPVALPAGLPVLQLANFEIPLLETVCGLAENPATDLPADGVAVYVADMNGVVKTDDLLAACPGSENVHDRTVMTTFADTALRTVYAAVIVAGPQASGADLDVAGAYLDSLGDLRITPTAPDSVPGPGYVLAAGDAGAQRWRLEAGVTTFADGSGEPRLGAALVTTDPDGAEGSVTQQAPAGGIDTEDTIQDFGDAGLIQWGTATSQVMGIDLVEADGTTTPATTLPWPGGLRNMPVATTTPHGSIWFASVATRGVVEPQLLGGPSASTEPSPSAPTAERLNTRTTSTDPLVVYGHDLGLDWEIRHANAEIQFFLNGAGTPEGSFSFSSGASTAVDVEGGTFLIGLFDPSVTSWSVTVDATDTTPTNTIDGRYTPAQDAAGHPANLWLLALPGSGTGTASDASALPVFVSWPQDLYPDGLFGSGSDGVVSWGIAHHSDGCALVKVIGTDPSDSGTSDCLPSWSELNRNGGATPLIGGFYGQKTATVVIVLPSGMPVNVAGGTPDCVDVVGASTFSGTEFCVFSLGNAEAVHVAFGENMNALGGPIQLSARPGALDLTDPAPTASP